MRAVGAAGLGPACWQAPCLAAAQEVGDRARNFGITREFAMRGLAVK
jgi:hypothetical protein